MAKRGLEGNFMAQPRILAHSVLPITEDLVGKILPFTEGRGCALYIGGQEPGTTSCDIVVRMEGSTDVGFGPEDIVVFRNVAPGSFLPILVTSVLESDEAFYEERINYLNEKIVELDQSISSDKTKLKDIDGKIAETEVQKKEAIRACQELPPIEAKQCESNALKKYDPIIEGFRTEQEKLEADIEDSERQKAEADAIIAESRDIIDSGLTVQTSAINVLGLF
jgi:uncharacterized coiled-coil protein SlyX